MKLKPLPANRVIKILTKIGFQIARQRGSHVFLRHPDGRTTVVPVHKGEVIGRGLLLKIIKDVKLTREECLKLIESL
jgi:predicted RNA binding protein YcfA (HicA-like mRNA interferase family)